MQIARAGRSRSRELLLDHSTSVKRMREFRSDRATHPGVVLSVRLSQHSAESRRSITGPELVIASDDYGRTDLKAAHTLNP